jgi:hypothetical protein
MKRWFAGLLVFLLILLAGAAIALAAPPSPYHVLHKEGAVYDPHDGWNMNTPPWYPGNDWAVDFLYRPGGPFAILHRDGAIYDSEYGWNVSTPPYYPGTSYAKALEYVVELSGCWCAATGGWHFSMSNVGLLQGGHSVTGYPNEYVTITQNNRNITVQNCVWTGAAYECEEAGGTVFGNHIILSAGSPGGANSCSWSHDLVGQYWWDYTADCFGIELARIQSDYVCQGTSAGLEEGQFGVVSLKQKYLSGETWVPCVCPPR